MIEFMRGVRIPLRNLDAEVGEDPVEQGGELRVVVSDQVPRLGAGILEVLTGCWQFPQLATRL
ncbi:hypothetical protein [Streptomyces sp. NPDC059349]|uniref:hypothetical protein n=1 Tax=Streptomyces sp. NPDC059349 TaxID=3346808 RepID=UPI0036B125A5